MVQARANNLGPGPSVTLYGVDWCPWVRQARMWLDGHGIEYDLVRVPDSAYERSEVLKESGQYLVPVIVVQADGGRHVFLDETDPKLGELMGVGAKA